MRNEGFLLQFLLSTFNGKILRLFVQVNVNSFVEREKERDEKLQISSRVPRATSKTTLSSGFNKGPIL